MPAALGTSIACASGRHAALVIDTGTREIELCVGLPGASVSGIDLVRLAAQQHGLDYSLGFGSQAVCRLAGTGPDGGDCWAEYPNFWGLWLQQGGGWVWASTGAASVSIPAGGAEGWSWGSGDGASGHPKPPFVTDDDVCGAAETPPSPSGTPAPHPSASAAQPSEGGGTPHPSAEPTPSQAPASPRRTSTPSPEAAPRQTTSTGATADLGGIAAASARHPGNGPPGAGIAAIALAAVLLAGGSFALRRRGRRAG